MSMNVFSAFRNPHGWGFKVGGNTAHPRQFLWAAYTRPECDTTFFVMSVDSMETGEEGTTVKGRTAIQKLPLSRPSSEVWAVPDYEAERLILLEHVWWRDYDAYQLHVSNDRTAAANWAHHQVRAQGRGIDLACTEADS